MVKRILGGILIFIAVRAIGGGIVSAYGLDKWAAQMIHVVESSGNLTAITEIISGGLALVCVICWLAFRVDEKIYNFISPSPKLGSLAFINFTWSVHIHVPTQTVEVEMVVTLENKNPELIHFNAMLCGQVNGKEHLSADGEKALSFDGYAYPSQPACLILRIPQAPVPFSEGWGSVDGTLEYDLLYFFPKSSRRKRRTRKKTHFSGPVHMSGIPGARQVGQRFVLFSEEQEE